MVSKAQSVQLNFLVSMEMVSKDIVQTGTGRPLHALEQKHRFSCVLHDCSDASINFLDQLYGGLVPGAGSGFNSHWPKHYYYIHATLMAKEK